MTVNDFFKRIKTKDSLEIAQFNKGSLSSVKNRDFIDIIEKIEAYLHHKIGKVGGNRIISIVENGISWNTIDFAIMMSGNIHIALSPSMPRLEIIDLLERLNPALILGSPLFLQINGSHIIGGFQIINTKDMLYSKLEYKSIDYRDKDLSTVCFLTSGTSDDKKAVVHPQEVLFDNVVNAANFYQFARTDLALSFLPIHYAFERMYNYIYLYCGIRIVYADRVVSLLDNILLNRPTVFCIVPALLHELIADSASVQKFLSYYKEINPQIICSGAKIPKSTRELLRKYEIEIYEMYGSTETLIVSCSKPNEVRMGSTGRIIDMEKVGIDSNGELFVKVKGSAYLEGFGNSDRFNGDVYKTGDLAKIDRGYLSIQGRRSNVVKNRFGLFIDLDSHENRLKQLLKVDNLTVFMLEGLLACIIENNGALDEYTLSGCLQNYNLEQERGAELHYFALTDSWGIHKELYTLSKKLKRNELIRKFMHVITKIE